jgi:hypothetical protein
MRFQARLESLTPLPSGEDADQLRNKVQEYIRAAERRDPSKSDELVSTVLDHVARDFFRHHAQKKRQRTL